MSDHSRHCRVSLWGPKDKCDCHVAEIKQLTKELGDITNKVDELEADLIKILVKHFDWVEDESDEQ